MKYLVIADTDVGIAKNTNQDSVLVRHADSSCGEVLMAVICDGMGGLAKGELASATLIRYFANWFDEKFSKQKKAPDMAKIREEWLSLLKNLNKRIFDYGTSQGIRLGTTFTGMFFLGEQQLIVHIGDSRAYFLDERMMWQLTTDHTFVAREVRRGALTPEQARVHKRKNVLLQCIGASEKIMPEVFMGQAKDGMYLLCSDGFRNKMTDQELYKGLTLGGGLNRGKMRMNVRCLIEELKERQEKDNISAIFIKTENKVETEEEKKADLFDFNMEGMEIPETKEKRETKGYFSKVALKLGKLFAEKEKLEDIPIPGEFEEEQGSEEDIDEVTASYLEEEMAGGIFGERTDAAIGQQEPPFSLHLLEEVSFIHTQEMIR